MSKSKTNKNSMIELLRFLFAMAVVLLHGNTMLESGPDIVMVSGRLGVEFFFILSGFLMAKTVAKHNEQLGNDSIADDTVQFIKRKIYAIMPNYYVAWIICFGMYHYAKQSGFKNIVKGFVNAIPELLLIHQSGLWLDVYNGPTWYISAMLICMRMIYPLMRKYKDIFNKIIAPIAFLFITGYMFQTFGKMTNPTKWSVLMFRGTLRSIAELLAGVFSYNIAMILKKIKFTDLSKILFTIVEISAYIMIFAFMWSHKASQYDFVIMLLFIGTIAVTMSNITYSHNLLNNKLTYWLGELSLSVYLGHTRIRASHKILFPTHWSFNYRMVAYVCLSILMGIFIMYISKLLKFLWKKYSKGISKWFIYI